MANALVFSRQAMPTLDRSIYGPAEGIAAWRLRSGDLGMETELILMAAVQKSV